MTLKDLSLKGLLSSGLVTLLALNVGVLGYAENQNEAAMTRVNHILSDDYIAPEAATLPIIASPERAPSNTSVQSLEPMQSITQNVTQPMTAVNEIEANLTEEDTGKELPVSLIKGQVSRQAVQYIMGPGDKISIKVQDLDKYNQDFTIRPDGYASIHPFGEVKLVGTDIQGLQNWLNKEFKFYLLKPNVTVNVEEMRPALIHVTGAVNKPGTYQFLRQGLGNSNILGPRFEKVEITLTNVLPKVGGLSESADVEHIKVIHDSTGMVEVFNLKAFLQGEAIRDVWLLPGDAIQVPDLQHPMDPETFKLVSRSNFYQEKFPVLVLGGVNAQGEVQVDPDNNSLNAAISLAGGFVKDFAEQNQIIVQRPMPNGTFSTWEVNRHKTNLALLPGDVVMVGKNKFSKVERAFRFAGSITQPFFFGAGGAQFLDCVGSRD